MHAQRFFPEFGHIANAPGGVGRLRELVLALAVRGKLVPQDPSEEPVRLGDIKEWVARLVQEGKVPRNRANFGLEDRGRETDLPPGWSAVKAANVFIPRSGNSQLIKGKLLTSPGKGRYAGYSASGQDVWLETFEYDGVAIIVSAVGARCGKAFLAAGKWSAIANTHIIWPVESVVRVEYAMLILNDEDFWERNGGAQPFVKVTETLEKTALIPPYTEQTRIVAKVDELMALCDQLEAQQQARRTLQNHLRQATLQTLANATSPHELLGGWGRLNSSFHQLFGSPADVGALRKLILELAVRGLLTEQKDGDTPAEQNLAEIRQLSSALTETGRRKKLVTFRAVDEAELGYRLPKGWAFARLGELVRVLNGRAYSKPELLDKGTPVLRVGNLFTSKDWYYSDLELEADKYCDEGDLLYAWSASFGPFIWTGPRVIFHYHIWKLDLFSAENLSREFLYLNLQERTEAIKSSGHGISMAHMTKEKMEQLPIAFPPLPEQRRIVNRVYELMRFCEELERQLRVSERLAERFAVSSVATLTGITPEQQEPPMRAPQTELLAPVRLGTAPDIKAQAPLATLLARHHGEMSAKDLWQRFGGEIDAFYAQLKTEVAHGWIQEPAVAEVRELPADPARA